MIRRRLFALLGAAWAACLFPQTADAHDARPLAVEITQQGDGRYLASMRVPPTVELANAPVLIWPDGCRLLQGGANQPGFSRAPQLAQCDGDLRGQKLGVRYAGYNPSLATLFRLKTATGDVLTQLLPPDQQSWHIPQKASAWQIIADYTALGIKHIWGGIDHLMFVAGLLLLAGSLKRILWAVTGFTLGHSITLSLAALGLVRLPVEPLEAAIALSILFLAREIVRPAPASFALRKPILVAAVFGLLHGFGFAAALQEIGLPGGELAAGLGAFNLGVELGQIGFIALIMLVGRLLAKGAQMVSAADLPLGRLRRVAGYCLGIPACFWLLERLGPFFT